MTKTAAQQLYRDRPPGGRLRRGAGESHVTCPAGGHQVHVYYPAWTDERGIWKAIREQVVDHLVRDCDYNTVGA